MYFLSIGLLSILIWINEFLEQLVRDLTNAYSRSQRCLVSVYHLAPQINEAFLVFLVAGGNCFESDNPWSICWLCSVSPLQRVFTHSLHDVLARTRDNSKRRGLIACVQTTTQTANFWAQIILDPYRRPLTLTCLLVSTRGLFQDMMFERLRDSTFSEDASEVIVQPLPCGTSILL